VKVYQRVCVREETYVDPDTQAEFKLEKGKSYTTSWAENGTVMLFSQYWIRVPVSLFAPIPEEPHRPYKIDPSSLADLILAYKATLLKPDRVVCSVSECHDCNPDEWEAFHDILNAFDEPGFEVFGEITDAFLKNYPPDVFTGESGDPGAVFVAGLRKLREALK